MQFRFLRRERDQKMARNSSMGQKSKKKGEKKKSTPKRVVNLNFICIMNIY